MSSVAISEMRLLVVIPCLNERQYIENLVSNLIRTNATSTRFVVADGGSTDGTLEIVRNLTSRFPAVSLLKNPKRIQSAGINLAVNNFGREADYVIRIDAHARYPDEYCRILMEEAEDTGAASVVVSMRTIGTTWFQQAVAVAQNSRLGNGGSGHRRVGTHGRWVEHGHHALIRPDAFLCVGGYDESFSHNEDAELDIRLRSSGFKIWKTGRTFIDYYARSSPRDLFLQYMNHGAGRARTMLKHRYLPGLRQVVPATVVPFTLLALCAPISSVAVVPLLGWTLVCVGYGIGLGIVHRRVSVVASGFAAMIMHIAWSIGVWKILLHRLSSYVSSVS